MNISDKCVSIVKQFEGFKSKPYLDAVGIPTIGYGSTFYEDDTKVSMKDKPITDKRALELLIHTLTKFKEGVNRSLGKTIVNQYQFDALVSFAYNVGMGNFNDSKLLKLIISNPSNKNIALEFAKWNKAKGKVLDGLSDRRKKESDLYFSV